ncbi:MAG: zf-TFIIB domain-containing protein [Patescibacteria group bacterium]
MLCPECKQPLTEKEVITSDNQKALIYECFNCGGHFLPPMVANLLPQVTVQDIDSITPKNTFPTNPTVICPVCQETMVVITDTVVPKNVTVYTCGQNHGNYFSLHQLYAFKRAQKTKLEYHQLWGIPIKSVFTVLLPIIAIFTAITAIPFTLQQVKSIQESRVKAGELVSNPLVSPISPTQTVISFTTKVNAITVLRLTLPDNTTRDLPGSVTAQKTHVFNLENLQPNTSYRYHLIVNGQTYGPYNFTTLSQ